MKISPFLLVSLLLFGCGGPAALVTDRGGAQQLVKDLKSNGKPLLFRRDGIVITLDLKTIAYLNISSYKVEVYRGDTWQKAVVSYKKDEKQQKYEGWISSGSALQGKCPGGPCHLILTSVKEFDFIMEETTDSSAVTDTTAAAAE